MSKPIHGSKKINSSQPLAAAGVRRKGTTTIMASRITHSLMKKVQAQTVGSVQDMAALLQAVSTSGRTAAQRLCSMNGRTIWAPLGSRRIPTKGLHHEQHHGSLGCQIGRGPPGAVHRVEGVSGQEKAIGESVNRRAQKSWRARLRHPLRHRERAHPSADADRQLVRGSDRAGPGDAGGIAGAAPIQYATMYRWFVRFVA